MTTKTGLSASHTEMVLKYLRFAVLQRSQDIKDLKKSLQEFKESRLGGDDTYTADEVCALVDNIGEMIEPDVFKDLQLVSHSAVVLLQQICGQVEAAGCSVSVDTSLLEDKMLLDKASDLEKESEKPTPQASLEPSASLKQMALPSLHSHKAAQSLELDMAQLKQRMQDLQRELTGVNREKTTLRQRLLEAEEKVASLYEFANKRTDASEAAVLQDLAGDMTPYADGEGAGEEEEEEEIPGSLTGLRPLGGLPKVKKDKEKREKGKGSSSKGKENSDPPPSIPSKGDREGVIEISPTSSGGGGGIEGRLKELESQVGSLKDQLSERSKAASELEAAMQGRLDKAPQFQSLQKMLAKKNAQNKAFREQLVAYGWVDPESE